ncbi:hypothetical protein [Nocardia neocaledoniensis]|uniref:hypothetical protein n=1 Tax=Nocardia neocaledoniensis TaxID=236511 RepID=UPI002458416B|nr:hypothetical protein [Nocardia neocaledoniensis]
MPDLLWNDVKNFFDPNLMGSLPDLWVPDASVEDWQAVSDLIRTNRWAWKCEQSDVERGLPSAEDVLAALADSDMITLRVWPVPGVEAIFRTMSATEIDFDMDLRELQGQTGVDTLCELLNAIGRRLGKPVFLCAEGQFGYPLLGFDPAADRVVLLADPRLPEEMTDGPELESSGPSGVWMRPSEIRRRLRPAP